MPFELRQWNENYNFKTTYGKLFRSYKQVTFDKKLATNHPVAEFVAPSHPLLEAVNEEILSRFEQHRTSYALFGDPERAREGALWFIEGEVTDGSGQAAAKRVFCLYQALDGTFQRINPAVLWDYDPLDEVEVAAHLAALLQKQDMVEDYIVTELLFPFEEEISTRRRHETGIKEKYGLRSLDYLIQESNQKILRRKRVVRLDYQWRHEAGEQLDLPLLNEQRNLEQLQQKRRHLEQEIELERNLTVNDPRILGAALVMPLPEARRSTAVTDPTRILRRTPPPSKDSSIVKEPPQYYEIDDKARKKEIELIGMGVAIAYEREESWQPEDVSGENHGFDVRSIQYNADGTLAAIRYIEVKARAHSGAIRLSANEWKKARRHAEQYWLYIVTQAASESRIQNPCQHFTLAKTSLPQALSFPKRNGVKHESRSPLSGISRFSIRCHSTTIYPIIARVISVSALSAYYTGVSCLDEQPFGKKGGPKARLFDTPSVLRTKVYG